MRPSIFKVIVPLALAAAFCSCESGLVVRGNGTVSSEQRSVGAFTSVTVSGAGKLYVHKGAQAVAITADSNLLPYITTSVSGSTLTIGVEPFTNIVSASELRYDVTLPDLSGVSISGACDASMEAFQGSSFSGSISGAGSMSAASLSYGTIRLSSTGAGSFTAAVAADSLGLEVSGSGGASLSGTAASASISISGAGGVSAKGLSVDSASVTITGTGSAELRVAKSLSATVSGVGSVRYWGSPGVSQRVTGIGSVAKAGD
jgi:Protein of unknown function (DUF2807).